MKDVRVLKSGYTVKIVETDKGKRALFFEKGKENEEPIENYAVSFTIVSEFSGISDIQLNPNTKGIEYYPVPNVNDEDGLFHRKAHDLIEAVKNRDVDVVRNINIPFAGTIWTAIKFIDREVGEKVRLQFMKSFGDWKKEYAIAFSTCKDNFLDISGKVFTSLMPDERIQTFATEKEAKEKISYILKRLQYLEGLNKAFMEEVSKKGGVIFHEEDSDKHIDLYKESALYKELDKDIFSFTNYCFFYCKENEEEFDYDKRLKLIQVLTKNGEVFRI